MSAGNIFDDEEKAPSEKPEGEGQEAGFQLTRPAADIFGDDAEANTLSAGMRKMAKDTGYVSGPENAPGFENMSVADRYLSRVYDFTLDDHRDAPRRNKTFPGCPETFHAAFKEFCRVYGLPAQPELKKAGVPLDEKQVLFEALRALGRERGFQPFIDLPDWSDIRKK